jgi:hypothetical protein
MRGVVLMAVVAMFAGSASASISSCADCDELKWDADGVSDDVITTYSFTTRANEKREREVE